MRFGPFSRVISAACTRFAVEGPPEPAINPVRGFDISLSSRPESDIACSIDNTAYAAPSPIKRICFLSICSLTSIFTEPFT